MGWLPDWLTGFDRENYEAGLEADRRNRELTEDLKRRGLITEADYQVALDHYDDSLAYDADAAIQGAFDTELDRRTEAVRDFGPGVISTGLRSTLGLIPWPVWLGLAAYVAWRLGLFNGILKR